MEQPKRILRKVAVQFISLVGKGANGKAIIWKSAAAGARTDSPKVNKTISILAKNDEKQLVYGIVYSPNETDSQGDTASAEVIQDMAYEFMRLQKTDAVDTQHDFQADEGYVAESWLVKAGDPTFPTQPTGSWAVAIKVTNPETWALVKSGEIGGLSLAGLAEVEEVQKSDRGFIQKMRDLFGITKDFNAEEALNDAREKTWMLVDAIRKILEDDSIADKIGAINASIAQFQASLAAEPVAKAGRVLSEDNMVKLGKAIGILKEVHASGATTKSDYPTITQHDEDTMNPEQITKAISDAIAPLTTKIEELTKQLGTIDAAQKETATTVEKIAKATPGSQAAQAEETPAEKSPWL